MANKVNNRYFGQTGTATPTIPVRVYTAAAAVVEGYIVNQVGARRFKCVDDTTVNDESLVVGAQYVIASVGDTDWAACGASSTATNRVFTATAAGSGTGTAYRVYTAQLVAGTAQDPTAANTATLVGMLNGSPVTLKKLNFRTAVDFNNNRYKWTLSDDSTQTLLVLTAI
jgi:hypothetical protein